MVFPAPPSIWNKIYSEFKSALALTMVADSQQHAEVEEELLRQFSKLIPSRCNTIAIVGAQISPLVLDFMHKCFRHCQIEDGYGITECGGVAFNNCFDPTVIYRLESVPEMNFTLEDQPFPRGELLTKTRQMFSGYVNNPTETRAALTDDGFFRTGDIVELRQIPDRPPYVYIIDRKKNFFKLSNGQFVSPEYLHGIFTRSAFIEQIFIHGDLQLYGSNVCGTREIIRLATYPSNCIPVQYISTISVLPPGIVEEMHIDAISPHCLTTGYGQTLPNKVKDITVKV
ncbi:unnamed protein product [Rotaria sordida]|uniref:long-chain-fatty-acid--CoA ligase n=1 Tax=Rotaria sordida TaxID=392033 RepID=A0A818M291_9BILA|nr:unnamed protein product [Rotaria sordida]